MVDAFKSEYWNLTQVMAWVLLGNRKLVQQAADGADDFGTFLSKKSVPDGTGQGAELRLVELDANRPTAIKLELMNVTYGCPLFPSYTDAEDDVIATLLDGKLEAYGLANGLGDLVPIKPSEMLALPDYHNQVTGAGGPRRCRRFRGPSSQYIGFYCAIIQCRQFRWCASR